MVTQTIGSQGGGRGGGKQQSQFQSLAKQSSLYSMNLDDFHRNVEPVELGITSSRLSSGSGTRHQENVTLSGALRSKSGMEKPAHDRQPMRREMTLEDYLAKSGTVEDGSGIRVTNIFSNVGSDVQNYPQGMHWLQQPNQQSSMGAYLSTGISKSSELVRELLDPQAQGHKRVATGDVAKKTVERRQKRMIKNRDSAARSRARKQAYTHELENKVSQLEEENEKLKKQKELNKVLQNATQPQPIYRLRRTTSATF